MRKKTVHVPLTLQMEEMEGGAACLTMILTFYRKQVSLDQVRSACGISRDGIHPQDIVRAGSSFGLTCTERHCSAGELEGKGCTLPAILAWEKNQFVVLEGFSSGKACLIHPAKGRIRLPVDTFEKKYREVCIDCTPGKEFIADGERNDTVAFLKAVLKSDGGTMILVLLTGFAAAAGGIISPVFSRIFSDDILSGQRTSWYPVILYFFAAVIFYQLIAMVIHQTLLIRSTGKLAVQSNAAYMHHLLQLPLSFFSRRRTGDLANRQNTNDTIAETLIGQLAPLIMNILMLVFYLVVMVQYSTLLTGIGFAAIVLNLLVARRVGTIRREISATQYRSQANLDSATVSGIDMIESIKATGSETGYFERWSGFHASVVRAQVRFNETAKYLLTLPSLIQKISDCIVLVTGCWLIIEGRFTVGILIAFLQFLQALASPVNDLLEAGENLQEMGASLERIRDVMDYPKEVDFTGDYDGISFEGVKKLSGQVELNHITFGYSQYADPLIEDFSLNLTPGKRIALVGESGSGKSTIARLIAGLIEPWSGEILFDKKPVREIPRAVFRSSLTMVNQDIALFHDTMENNIRMWDSSIADYEVKLAARDAGIHDFVMSSNEGYRMMLEENGKNLSGGERQRVEIARALSADPSILIMDEATSALDARTEFEISKYVESRGITCIIVAHRLSTIRDCDEIIVLREGKVVERGTHDALIARGGYYRELIQTA